MKKNICLLLFTCILVTNIHAQVGKVGINTDTPAAMLHVKDSSVVFTGPALPTFPIGDPPITGPGMRMMWYADLAAFRVGHITGSQWNKDSIGLYSFAQGYNTRASGYNGIAMGFNTKADGNYSVALGVNNTATGLQSSTLGSYLTATGTWSTAIGVNNIASGDGSLSMGAINEATGYCSTAIGYASNSSGSYAVSLGYQNTASGQASFATGQNSIASGYACTAFGSSKATGNWTFSMGTAESSGTYSLGLGRSTIAKSYACLALGQFNDSTSISSYTWDPADPVFIIGNGTSDAARSNAFTVLKNGRTGINTFDPKSMLHIIKNGTSGGPFHSNATTILESNQHSYLQFSQTNNTESGFLSGNNLTSIRSALIFSADSSMLLRTGGNTTRVKISNEGNVGLGTVSPAHRLHVVNNNSADGGWTEGIVIESINANAGEAAISVKNVTMPPDKQWMMGLNQNPYLAFNYGAFFAGTTTKMIIDTFGKVGIGTLTPAALLDIEGTIKLGTNGIALTEIIKVTIAKDVASIAANTTLGVDFTVTNSAVTSTVFVSPENDLPNGIVIAYSRVSAAGNVRVGFRNTTALAIDPAGMNYYITVIR